MLAAGIFWIWPPATPNPVSQSTLRSCDRTKCLPYRGVVALIRRRDNKTSVFSISGDMDGLRPCDGRHAVEHACTNRDFGCLGANLASPQAGASKGFEPVHQSLDQRVPVVANRLLPFAPAAFCDCVDGSIAPSRAGWPRRRSLTGRNRQAATCAAICAWHALVS